MADRSTRTAYWPTRPAVRRDRDRPSVAAVSSCSGPPSRSSPAIVTTLSSAAAVASTGIVDPPLEEAELQGRDHQRHEEQPDRVDGADADVVRAVQPVDLEHQRLGGAHGPALGDDVDLGEGLQAEDDEYDQQEQE